MSKQEPILHELVTTICAEMLVQGNLAGDFEQGLSKVEAVLTSGQAAEVFAKMVSELGGPNDLLENPDKYLAKANVIQAIYPEQAGFIHSMDSRMIGMSVVELGGGRRMATDSIDYSVGFSDFLHIGDYVELNQPIAFVHARTQTQANNAAQEILQCVKIGHSQIDAPMLIIEKVV
jgi:thymidine phosphorylase